MVLKSFDLNMRKRLTILLFVLAVAATSHAQTVYQKDRWGAKLLFFQENAVRVQDRWGEQILWYDAAYSTVRLKDRWGEKLLYIDGLTVRQTDRWGAPLLYFDGNTLRVKDRWGAAVYYFDFTPSRWQIACVVLM